MEDIIFVIGSLILIIGGLLTLVIRNEITGFVPCIIGLILLIVTLQNIENNNQIEQPKYIDLPEEWDQISNKPNNPDTMISYLKHDTLFIKFK